MRKVIQITDNGIFLCNDGSMWERKSKGYNGVYDWKQIDDIPQPENNNRSWDEKDFELMAESMKTGYKVRGRL